MAPEEAPSLRSLQPFETLTAAEAEVFERNVEERRLKSGDGVDPSEHLIVLREGALQLEVPSKSGQLGLGTIDAGGLIGEADFFAPATRLTAKAEKDSVCWFLSRNSLKNAFRYSRTGAVKFLVVFARSLSNKIRWANDLLQTVSASGAAPGEENIRPDQLNDLDLKRLQTLFAHRSYEGEAVVFQEGEPGEELFVIREGEVEILKQIDSGATINLARLGTGDFFGELAFIDRKPRSAAAVARGPLDVYVLPAGSVERALSYNVATALYLTSVICKIMARRLNVTLARIGLH